MDKKPDMPKPKITPTLIGLLCILGIAVIGAVGFVIRYVFAMIGLISGG